ncbi:MAG: hypothetical protein AB7D51_00810 [Desulfovibrionaceae bacterium]
MNAVDPLGLMALFAPDKIARQVHKRINPMSTERIIEELADEEITNINSGEPTIDATVDQLNGLKEYMKEEGLPSPYDAIKKTLQ